MFPGFLLLKWINVFTCAVLLLMFQERRIGKTWPSSTGAAQHSLPWWPWARGGGDMDMSALQLGQGPAVRGSGQTQLLDQLPLRSLTSLTALGSPWSEPRRDICPVPAGLECGHSHPGVGTALPRLWHLAPLLLFSQFSPEGKTIKKISLLIWGKVVSRSLIWLHSTRCFFSLE